MTAAAAWHALPLEDVLRRLDTSRDGLSQSEAAARLARFGPNALRAPRPVSIWRVVGAQLKSVIVLLLVVAAAVAALAGDWLDAGAIAAVLAVNVALGVGTELPARRAIEALHRLEVPRATVRRGGELREVDARELVPGDLIALETGQTVPADARLVQAVELRTVEAPLTGESLEAEKHGGDVPAEAPLAERPNMVYGATAVAAGRATAVVVATGAATEVGRIGKLVGAIRDERTPLERRLDALGRRLAIVALAVGALVAGSAVLQGVPLAQVVQLGIALAVAAVPEGLPAVVTIATALGVWRMARRRALVRRLAAVETLGSATVICADKTGTLTTGRMTATAVWLDGRDVEAIGAAKDSQLAAALRVAALASRASLEPTDGALLAAARDGGIERAHLLEAWPEVGELPFSSARMLTASFHREPEGRLLVCVKGAPAHVLARCDRILGPTGPRALDEATRRAVVEGNEAMAGAGLRVLALAGGRASTVTDSALSELVFLGLVGLTDPPAPGVADTVQRFREAGVRTIMLTGDQRRTAEAVGRAIGLLAPGDVALDAPQLDRLSDPELDGLVDRLGVVSRVSPEAKLRVVSALQRRGEIVAMLGDGVNDAPALKRADIGVTMGGRGTDVAKEAADVILQDDRFQTIGVALEQGRVISDNIRKFVFYLFSCNLAEILVFLGAGLLGWPTPLLPLQILWLNLVTDTFPALALALEPAEPGVMRRGPRAPRRALLTGALLRLTVWYAALIAAATLTALAWGHARWPLEPERAATLAFMTLAGAQIFHLGNARSAGPVTAARRALANPYALVAVAIALALQLVAVSWSPLAGLLGTRAPRPDAWLVIGVLALLPAVLGQVWKGVRYRRRS